MHLPALRKLIPPEMLTQIAKEFYEFNGTPEDYPPGMEPMDFMVLAWLRKKLEI